MKKICATDKSEMASIAADIIGRQVSEKKDSVLGLATGASPLYAYRELVNRYKNGQVSFKGVRTFNLDEYCGLPPTSTQSYHYYMKTNLFQYIDINPLNTFIPDGVAENKEAECERFTKLIDEHKGIDLQVLGIGNNGHIGFNEPDHCFHIDTHCVELHESTRNANAAYFPGGVSDMPRNAITMGIRSIMQSRRILLLAGSRKKQILQEAFGGVITPDIPASILQLHTNLIVIYFEENQA
jgi:glucosamine-6-phosphate deaminase